ncbi:MAG: caspase family protein [Bacteroidales bacterium]|nr:caspase family protein [Bacteroidales bacterium]
MKKNILLLLIALAALQGFAQEIKGRSGEYNFNITKDPPKPPYLEIETASIELTDQNGNAAIDAAEEVTISFTLKNSGRGDGIGLKLHVTETGGAAGLTFDKDRSLPLLPAGQSTKLEHRIKAGMNTENGKAIFQLAVTEPNGFDSDPVVIEVETRAFKAPKLILADYAVRTSQGNRIQKRRPFELEILVQNTGVGVADHVSVKLLYPENMYCTSANEISTFVSMASGDSKTIKYELITNNLYQQNVIPLKFEISEKHGKYGQTKEITLEIDQEIAQKELVINPVAAREQQAAITIGTLTSEVDKNIPASGKTYPRRYALIIGNENYTDYQMNLTTESNVAFAQNDAAIFAQYAQKTLGVEQQNIFHLTNATAATMKQEINRVTEIIKRAGSDAELIFYYAGHGFPDENTRTPYLMPVDVSAANLTSAIKLSDIYQKFAETGAARVLIFLDACFSGGGRESGLLAARAVKVRPKEDIPMGNMVVFSASTGEQTSLPYQAQKHGMFTYHLLKKLQETGGNISLSALSDYLGQQVGIESLRVNAKPQDPTTLVSPAITGQWENWLMNP